MNRISPHEVKIQFSRGCGTRIEKDIVLNGRNYRIRKGFHTNRANILKTIWNYLFLYFSVCLSVCVFVHHMYTVTPEFRREYWISGTQRVRECCEQSWECWELNLGAMEDQ